jgi:hypothetical protein
MSAPTARYPKIKDGVDSGVGGAKKEERDSEDAGGLFTMSAK